MPTSSKLEPGCDVNSPDGTSMQVASVTAPAVSEYFPAAAGGMEQAGLGGLFIGCWFEGGSKSRINSVEADTTKWRHRGTRLSHARFQTLTLIWGPKNMLKGKESSQWPLAVRYLGGRVGSGARQYLGMECTHLARTSTPRQSHCKSRTTRRYRRSSSRIRRRC